jgi:7-cyano-7-deazaguanine synthase in queuosine biosynthesis
MFSGGIDSTYLLYDYLTHTDHPVHAHHVSIRYPLLQRWRAEDPASESIVSWCRTHLRDFEYSASRFDLDVRCVGWDSDLYLLIASKVAMNLDQGPIRVALGWCADDLDRPQVQERQRRSVTDTLWKALCESTSPVHLDSSIAMPLVERGLTKAEVIARLPAPLVAMSWSCRQPVFASDEPTPCLVCHACRLREEAIQAASTSL